MVNTRHKHVKLDLTCTSHVSQQYHNASDGIHSVPHLHGIKSRKRQIDEGKTHIYGSSNHYRRWIHSIVQSHSQECERRKNKQNANTKNSCTELATVFFAELPTQHTVLELSALDQCLIVTVNSENIVVVVVVAVKQQHNNQYIQLDSRYNDPQQTCRNRETPGRNARVLIPPLGSSQTQGSSLH